MRLIEGLPVSQLKSPGFGTHAPLVVHTAVISGPESHLKVATVPSIIVVKFTKPLLGLGGTPQVAERGYIQFVNTLNVDISLHTYLGQVVCILLQLCLEPIPHSPYTQPLSLQQVPALYHTGRLQWILQL